MIVEKIKKEIIEVFQKKYSYHQNVEYSNVDGVDLACPLFKISKLKNIKIEEIFDSIKSSLSNLKYIKNISYERGYANIKLDENLFSHDLFKLSLTKKIGQKDPNNKVVVIDFSSPNIAKRFSIGHVRSTVLGNSIKKIYELMGYKVIGVNHLGDWGTQFGKMIYALETYGSMNMLQNDPIKNLNELYVKFHKEEKNNPEILLHAKKIFNELENGNEKYLSIWKEIKKHSLVEFQKYYKLLNVDFDYFTGESFYNNKLNDVVERMKRLNILEKDQDANIVRLNDLPPALISKSDGSSLYITRDIAAAIYRSEEFKADKLLYVVGNEQSLHFKQLQRVLNKMNENIEIVHINFGLVMQNGKKMSTRTGDVQTLDYVLNEAIHMAKYSIEQKNPNLSNKEKVAEKIAMSAIVYNDLKNEKHLNIDFNLANMLKFEGQTGPYLQYTSVRMSSLLQKIDSNLVLEMNTIIDKSVFKLGLHISRIDEIIEKAYSENQPSIISRFAFELAQMFNSWYGNSKIITDNLEKTKSNLSVVYASKKTLDLCLKVLGIEILNEM